MYWSALAVSNSGLLLGLVLDVHDRLAVVEAHEQPEGVANKSLSSFAGWVEVARLFC